MQKEYIEKNKKFPRITREQLCSQLDEILDRVEREGIGFVVTKDGKDDLLLCPAWWFNYTFDENFSVMIESSVRNALTQDGLIPGQVGDYIRKHLNVINIETIDRLVKEISEALEQPETIPNAKAWEVLRLDLEVQKKEYEKRIELIRASRESKETVDLPIEVDLELLKKADATFIKLGMTLNEAITIFLEETIKRGRLPFDRWRE